MVDFFEKYRLELVPPPSRFQSNRGISDIDVTLTQQTQTQTKPPMTTMDVEKSLFSLKRKMTARYSKGQYGEALELAKELETSVKINIGVDNTLYASAMNNVALMCKLVGELDESMECYTRALQIYEDCVGREHTSYAATLTNLGILYKTKAEDGAKGMDKDQLLARAEEAIEDGLTTREALSKTGDFTIEAQRDIITSANQLASILKLRGKVDQAERKYRRTLETCRHSFGDLDSLTATTLNNLGVLLKSKINVEVNSHDPSRDSGIVLEGKNLDFFTEAEHCYVDSLNTRRNTLGQSHPDTIISMHNLGELYIAVGLRVKAETLQSKILDQFTDFETTYPTSSKVHGDENAFSLPIDNSSSSSTKNTISSTQVENSSKMRKSKPPPLLLNRPVNRKGRRRPN